MFFCLLSGNFETTMLRWCRAHSRGMRSDTVFSEFVDVERCTFVGAFRSDKCRSSAFRRLTCVRRFSFRTILKYNIKRVWTSTAFYRREYVKEIYLFSKQKAYVQRRLQSSTNTITVPKKLNFCTCLLRKIIFFFLFTQYDCGTRVWRLAIFALCFVNENSPNVELRGSTREPGRSTHTISFADTEWNVRPLEIRL